MYTFLSGLIYAYIHIFNWKNITDFHNVTIIKPEQFLKKILIALRFAYFEPLILIALNLLTTGNFIALFFFQNFLQAVLEIPWVQK